MARLALGLLMLLLVAVAVWAMFPTREVKVAEPEPTAGNTKWAVYYRRLAEQAACGGDQNQAEVYRRIAETYEWLDREERK